MDIKTTPSIMQTLGVIFIILGITGMTGIYKKWYWTGPNRIYGYLPFGLLLILASIEDQIKTWLGENSWVLLVAYFLILGFGMWGFIKPLKCFKPAWIKRIEQEPKFVFEDMAISAKKSQEWRAKVSSVETLNIWIKEIHKKHPHQKNLK